MKIARVVGTVVSTIRAPVFDGRRLLLCDLLEPGGEAAGGYLIAVDTVGAGAGETVLLIDEGNSARQIIGLSPAPIRTLVVGIVDAIELAAGDAGPVAPVGPAAARPAGRAARRTAGPARRRSRPS